MISMFSAGTHLLHLHHRETVGKTKNILYFAGVLACNLKLALEDIIYLLARSGWVEGGGEGRGDVKVDKAD
jgi:hypothetical protein